MLRSPLLPLLPVGLLLVLGALLLFRQRSQPAPPVEGVWATDINEAPPGTLRLGEKATGPLPGQKRPPCEPRLETEVAGACWIAAKARPPCPSGLYEGGGDCLVPVRAAQRPPTSIAP